MGGRAGGSGERKSGVGLDDTQRPWSSGGGGGGASPPRGLFPVTRPSEKPESKTKASRRVRPKSQPSLQEVTQYEEMRHSDDSVRGRRI